MVGWLGEGRVYLGDLAGEVCGEERGVSGEACAREIGEPEVV